MTHDIIIIIIIIAQAADLQVTPDEVRGQLCVCVSHRRLHL